MKRIIMHWTGSKHEPNDSDLNHYHAVVDGSGRAHMGKLHPEANESTKDGVYAAHTRRLNTGSIGLAMASMFGAKDHPFDAGKHPITEKQLRSFVVVVADYAETYGIPVTRKTVLTHAEVEPTLKVKQRNKWDICWLPGMTTVGDAIDVGDKLRDMVKAEMQTHEKPEKNHKTLWQIIKGGFSR